MKRLLTGILIGGLAGGAFAQPSTGPLSVEDRVYPRPQTSTPSQSPNQPSSAPASQRGSGESLPEGGVMMLMQQINAFEGEIQRLEGMIEQLRHELDTARSGERERYLDLDTRINALAEASIEQSEQQSAGSTATDGAGGDAASDRAAYGAAREKLLGRQFPEAGKAFESYLKDYPRGQFRPFAHFWLGEIYRSQSTPDRDKAMAQFRKVVDDFPDHSQVPAALYKLATLEAESGDINRAKVTLNRIIRQFDGSSEARLARGMLEQLEGA
ncbi:MAG: tol-pal system protein YbgF [Alcanivorax sp.]|nr:tol-pal system protein YbgF [Alcanivorax sp.]